MSSRQPYIHFISTSDSKVWLLHALPRKLAFALRGRVFVLLYAKFVAFSSEDIADYLQYTGPTAITACTILVWPPKAETGGQIDDARIYHALGGNCNAGAPAGIERKNRNVKKAWCQCLAWFRMRMNLQGISLKWKCKISAHEESL